MACLGWLQIVSVIAGVIWWGWLLYSNQNFDKEGPKLAKYLGIVMTLPLSIGAVMLVLWSLMNLLDGLGMVT